jgi:hypothetical protein
VASRRQAARASLIQSTSEEETSCPRTRIEVRWGRYLGAIEAASIATCDAFSPEVTLDATVPNWRFSVRGEDAGANLTAAQPGRVTALHLEITEQPDPEVLHTDILLGPAGRRRADQPDGGFSGHLAPGIARGVLDIRYRRRPEQQIPFLSKRLDGPTWYTCGS